MRLTPLSILYTCGTEYYTFLYIIEQQATRAFIPQWKISICVEWYKNIETNMLKIKPNAQSNAFSKFVLLGPSELKYDNIPPISKGWDTLQLKK